MPAARACWQWDPCYRRRSSGRLEEEAGEAPGEGEREGEGGGREIL